VVIHYTDESKDTGDTIDVLYHSVLESGMPLVERLVADLVARTLSRKPQDMTKYLFNYEMVETNFRLDFRQPAELLIGMVLIAPGKFYFIYIGEKYHMENCSVIDELVKARKFCTGVSCELNGRLTFVTPRRFLQIERLAKVGGTFDPI
jgi:methionyl-tRNA formyltransferase